MDFQILLPFIVYFLIVVAIGLYSARFSSKGMNEYFLGGRQMGRFVVALSAVASGRSAWLLLGFTGLAYMIGFSALWTAAGYIVIEFLLFVFYAPRIRKFSEENDCITVPDYFAARFNDKSGLLRIIIVIVFLIFMVTYVGAQFVAGGKAFSASLGVPVLAGLLITAFIVLLYTILGGFLAVSLTDVVQAIFMIIVLVAIPVVVIYNLGGWENTMNILGGLTQIDKSGVANSGLGELLNPFSLSLVGAMGALGIGLGSPGSPHVIVRYMSIKDPDQFTWTAVVGTVWNVVMAGGALFIGMAGRARFNDISEVSGGDVENVFLNLAEVYLHPALVGLLLAAIFAAIMSTADSQLLVAASSVVRDLYEKILKKGEVPDQKRMTLYSRLAVTSLVVLSVLLAIFVQDLVFWFVLFAWAGLGAAIGPTSILALFWKRTTRAGVIAGLLTGTVTVFVWKLTGLSKLIIYELIPGFVLAFLVTIIVSLLTRDK